MSDLRIQWADGAAIAHAFDLDAPFDPTYAAAICGSWIIKPGLEHRSSFRHCKRCKRRLESWTNSDVREAEIFSALCRDSKARAFGARTDRIVLQPVPGTTAVRAVMKPGRD